MFVYFVTQLAPGWLVWRTGRVVSQIGNQTQTYIVLKWASIWWAILCRSCILLVLLLLCELLFKTFIVKSQHRRKYIKHFINIADISYHSAWTYFEKKYITCGPSTIAYRADFWGLNNCLVFEWYLLSIVIGKLARSPMEGTASFFLFSWAFCLSNIYIPLPQVY